MTDSVLRVIIDSTGAQSGAQAVNQSLSSITGTATQSINTLQSFSTKLLNQLNAMSSGFNFNSMASSFAGAMSSMSSSASKFFSGLASQLGGGGIHGTARSFGKRLGDAINDGLTGALKGIRNMLLDVFSFAAIESFLQKIADVGTQVQRFKTVVGEIRGSSEAANDSFENVRSTANKFGLAITSLTQPYTRLIAASKETKLSGDQVDTMFRGIAAASSTYHLGQSEVNLVMLAFNQMISKGTVSMEELRRQLGERIPGAFEMAATAMKVTTEELEKLIKTGRLKGPEFAALMGQVFDEKFSAIAEKVSKTFFGAMNRASNEVFKFFEIIGNAGVLDAFTAGIEKFISLVQSNYTPITAFGKSVAEIVNQFVIWFSEIKTEDISKFFNAVSTGLNILTNSLKFIVENADTITRVIGMAAGAKAGAVIGATIGTVVGGPVGTAVGGLAGGILGLGIGGLSTSLLVNKSKSNAFGAKQSVSGRITEQEFPGLDAFGGNAKMYGGRKITPEEVLKAAKAKKGLSDGQKSFNRAESIGGSFDRFTRDFMDGLTPRKAVSNVPTIDQERFENQIKLAHKHTDAMEKLNIAKRDGKILEKDYNSEVADVTNTYSKSLVVLEDVLQKREEFRRAEAKEVIDKTLTGFSDKAASTFDQLRQGLSTQYLDAYDKKQAEIARSLTGNYLEAQHIFTDQLNSGKITSDEYKSAIERLTASYEGQKTEVADLIIQTRELNESWIKGATDGIGQYIESISGMASKISSTVSKAFKGMEDALVNFVKTGKLDFKSLADSIVSDMIRMQIQQSIMKPIAKEMNTGGGGGDMFGRLVGLAGSVFGTGYGDVAGVAAGVPQYATGTDYVPNDGLAFLHEGEAVVTKKENTERMSGAPIQVVNHFNFSYPIDPRTQTQIAAAAGAGLQRAMARNN